ncbi:hypothetical protein Tco_0189952 [Tanacetum coccineum]
MKDFSFEEILDDLFRIGGENLINMEHEEVPNRCDEETVGNMDHESGNLLNFPTFLITNEIASDCIQEEENIIVSTTKEIEEVKVEDVEMNENHDVDYSNTKEALQWSLDEDPFFVFIEPRGRSNFMQQITPSSISNEVSTARGWIIGITLACGYVEKVNAG